MYNKSMIPVSPSETPVLTFTSLAEKPQEYRASANKIGWLHTQQKPGTEFDLRIKDIHGHTKFERVGIKAGAETYGELANIPCLLGEQLFIEVSNIKGSDKVAVLLN